MSPVHVAWDGQDARLLRITLTEPVDWPAVETARQHQDRSAFPPFWVALVELPGAISLPPLSTFRLAQLLGGNSTGARAFAVVGAGHLSATLQPRLARLFPSLEPRLYLAGSEPDARRWLRQQLAMLENTWPEPLS